MKHLIYIRKFKTNFDVINFLNFVSSIVKDNYEWMNYIGIYNFINGLELLSTLDEYKKFYYKVFSDSYVHPRQETFFSELLSVGIIPNTNISFKITLLSDNILLSLFTEIKNDNYYRKKISEIKNLENLCDLYESEKYSDCIRIIENENLEEDNNLLYIYSDCISRQENKNFYSGYVNNLCYTETISELKKLLLFPVPNNNPLLGWVDKLDNIILYEEFSFGKYKSKKVLEIIKTDFQYISWCINNIPFFVLPIDLLKEKSISRNYNFTNTTYVNAIKSFFIIPAVKYAHSDLQTKFMEGMEGQQKEAEILHQEKCENEFYESERLSALGLNEDDIDFLDPNWEDKLDINLGID